jgi:hypothetical protein
MRPNLLCCASIALITYSLAGLPARAADQINTLGCDAIDAAISSTEDFAEAALAGNTAAAQAGAVTIAKTFRAIAPALSKQQKDSGEKQASLIETTLKAGDLPVAALQATDMFRSLTDILQSRLPTSLEVAMLDHAGFRLQALVAQNNVDWPAVAATANEANANWQVAKQRIENKALQDLGSTLHEGLLAAVVANNIDWLKAMAHMELDSVDLLEKNVTSTGEQACR